MSVCKEQNFWNANSRSARQKILQLLLNKKVHYRVYKRRYLDHNKALCNISQHSGFFCEELLALRPTRELEDHLLSAVHDCLFIIRVATLHLIFRFLQAH
jgi:hypothetical protein